MAIDITSSAKVDKQKMVSIVHDFIVSYEYKLFFGQMLKGHLKKLNNELLQVDKEKNVVQYTEHDVTRKVIAVLNDIYKTPTDMFKSLDGLNHQQKIDTLNALGIESNDIE